MKKGLAPGSARCYLLFVMRKRSQIKQVSRLEGRPDPVGFFEAVKLAGLEGVPFVLSFALQRKHFGAPVFGKRRVVVDGDGWLSVSRSVAYGQDWEVQELFLDQFTRCFRSRFDNRVMIKFNNES